MNTSSFSILNCLLVLLAFLARELPAQDNLSRHEFAHHAMGIEFHLILFAESRDQATRVFELAKSRIDELDECLSDYRQDSEVNRLCQSAPHHDFQVVSSDLRLALCQSLRFSEMTDGAFDCTIGPSSHLWRAAIKRNRLPSQAQIAAAHAAVGWKHILCDNLGQFKLARSGMQLDFGGIAQGIAADEILKIFRSQAIQSGLVDASGDIATLGAPPNESGWRIVIDDGVNPRLLLSLCDLAVSTSGDHAQVLVLGDERHSHLVDPRSGLAVKGEKTATVIAADATTADALASAFCILDFSQASALASTRPDTYARISWVNHVSGQNARTLKTTCGFDRFLTTEPNR